MIELAMFVLVFSYYLITVNNASWKRFSFPALVLASLNGLRAIIVEKRKAKLLFQDNK